VAGSAFAHQWLRVASSAGGDTCRTAAWNARLTASRPTYNGFRESRSGPSSIMACVAWPGSSPVACRRNSRSDQPFHRRRTAPAPSRGAHHPPEATGSPRYGVASQPTSRGAPIATGGQSRNATVSSEPWTRRSLSPLVAAAPDVTCGVEPSRVGFRPAP
jgi:hypothetical protein